MDYEIEVEVFRQGDYGPRGRYGPDELDRLAADYDPRRHEAPVTVDHRQDGPAQGWVRGLRRCGEALMARIGGLDPAFLDQLKAGAFKKRSVEIYRRFAPKDRPYLKALSFLGAGTPVVKGMADPVFSENEESLCLTFSDSERAPEPTEENHAEPETPETTAPADTPAAPDREAARAAWAELSERLRAEGRLLPAWERRGLAEFFCALDDTPALPAPEGEAHPQSPRGWFRDFLLGLEPAVALGESAPETAPDRFAEPHGAPARGGRLDEPSLELHRRALRLLRRDERLPYTEALRRAAEGA